MGTTSLWTEQTCYSRQQSLRAATTSHGTTDLARSMGSRGAERGLQTCNSRWRACGPPGSVRCVAPAPSACPVVQADTCVCVAGPVQSVAGCELKLDARRLTNRFVKRLHAIVGAVDVNNATIAQGKRVQLAGQRGFCSDLGLAAAQAPLWASWSFGLAPELSTWCRWR